MKHINKRTDPVSRRALKKSVKAAERQLGKKELQEALPNDFYFNTRWSEWDEYPHEHWDDWQGWRPFTENTIGGKFLETLIRLGLIQRRKERWGDHAYHQDIHWLYEKLAVAPDGYIYVSDPSVPNGVTHFKADTATAPKLSSKISK